MEVNLCRYTVDKIALIYHYLMATVEAATEILELNAELNALLFSTSLEASIEIRRLRQEIMSLVRLHFIEILKNITGTTIASSGIGQDVLADDAEHTNQNCGTRKSMKKMRKRKKNRKRKMKKKRKMKRRMKTKLG
ncbi:hypothetical protein GBA52_026205 [Prunus armeniaca]|nr:hypothetical protein GBA52_026205 [Prunus armeniaca]